MTTVTLVANDQDLSDLYGILDSSKHNFTRKLSNIFSEWCQMLSDLYRTNKEGYYVLFRGDDIGLLRLSCEDYRQNHRTGTQYRLSGHIIDVIGGVTQFAVDEDDEDGQRKEREMLQQRAETGDAWDTGMDVTEGWTVEENVQGFSDDGDVPY